MAGYSSHFWKKAPLLKLLPAMIGGIMLQWQFQFGATIWWLILVSGLIILLLFSIIPLLSRYKLFFISAVAAFSVFIAIGALLARMKDPRNDKDWLRNFYKEKDGVVATLNEPLSEKTKSYKANATINYIIQDGKKIPVKGKIIVYLRKDSLPPSVSYGSNILFTKSLQEIKNSGNPGGFDYKRYALFQGITHQVFLKSGEYEILDVKKQAWFRKFIFSTRETVLNTLRKNITGEKELGLAEALLIGYKDDLDQSLVQSYTNTGVVHIIAISGLHLGLIYWLLVQLFRPLQKKKKWKWLRPVFIITGLWLFSLLAGAQPSVLRSAVMFTCIVIGDGLGRKSSIFNTLAFSAFILLCINPYWLWDVGFQLSYAAVLSIVIFIRPIYNWFYIKNKILDFIWKLNAVTIAAQILTVPLSIYHFHQFPNYFLLTNFLAVPLSSFIVLGEIFLCAVGWIPVVAAFAGKILSWMIWLMNTWIEKIELLRFSLWDGMQITLVQAILLLVFAAGISYWLIEKVKKGLLIGLAALLCFVVFRSFSFIAANKQQKIIVYNVPQRRAIDFVDGRKYFFIGDTDLLADAFLRNFHLKPSRILFRITPDSLLPDLKHKNNYIQYHDKNILLIDFSVSFQPTDKKSKIDLLLVSGNPRFYITNLAGAMDIKQVVFDGSVPAWKATYWKKDCDSLHIPWHDVTAKGAFVMNLR
ncbi:MAG: ComEC family competence protein [Sphingobacteriales bacterium]|nr:ComEC family competence protein [Sphingobacteriales bacterium]